MQVNGIVERMNRTVKEVTVKAFHYPTSKRSGRTSLRS
jgi:hypothetical protein